MQSFHGRALPPELPALPSPAGRALFQQALHNGDAEAFFAISAHFHTQGDPSWCAYGSLVTALNALDIDPGRVWKGPWRYFGEDLLDCCKPVEEAKQQGVNLAELACLAHCNGAEGAPRFAAEHPIDALREDLRAAVQQAQGAVLIVNYARSPLGQTGAGHFSPIGAYAAAEDMALIMDVARFKYPPHWVPLPTLFQAMRSIDPDTGASRGWITLRPSHLPPGRCAPGFDRAP
jgi:glutathione gamma-glutamylcysteinyltransferase